MSKQNLLEKKTLPVKKENNKFHRQTQILTKKWFTDVMSIGTVSYTHLDVYKRQI